MRLRIEFYLGHRLVGMTGDLAFRGAAQREAAAGLARHGADQARILDQDDNNRILMVMRGPTP